jgi:hypothetical protein
VSTLRDKAYENVSSERSVFGSVAGGIRSAPAVDCSEAVRFFLEQTPEESGFSVGDIPLLSGIEWLYRGNGGVFLETAPPEDGLMWGTLLTSAVDRSDIASAFSTWSRKLGVDCEIRKGDPGMVLIAGGAVSSAGVFVSVDKPLADEDREAFYDSLFSGMVDLEDLRCILQLTFFVELGDSEGSDKRTDDGSGSGDLIEPAMIWYLPVSEEDEALSFAGGSDELKLFAPGVGQLAHLEDVVDFVAQAQRPLLLSALFSLACLGASDAGTGSSPRVTATGSDTVGPVYSVNMIGLSRMLEIEGRASDLGLSHALTVCRGEFEIV